MVKTIFYDVDTQNDFMNPDGALYVPEAVELKPNFERLTRHACERGIPIFGSVDRHFGTPEYKDREGELQRWNGQFPDHCMTGTKGQQKISETLHVRIPRQGQTREKNYVVPQYFITNPLGHQQAYLRFQALNRIKEVQFPEDNDLSNFIFDIIKKNTTSIATEDDPQFYYGAINIYTAGIFFEKQTYDVASNPLFAKVMRAVAPERAIVYGVATDYCVKAGVMALKSAGVPEIYVVTDSIKGITPEGVSSALEEMALEGVRFLTTDQMLEEELK